MWNCSVWIFLLKVTEINIEDNNNNNNNNNNNVCFNKWMDHYDDLNS